MSYRTDRASEAAIAARQRHAGLAYECMAPLQGLVRVWFLTERGTGAEKF